jgi:hypothetical protein
MQQRVVGGSRHFPYSGFESFSGSYKLLTETHIGHTGKKLTFSGLTAVLTTKAKIRIIDPIRLYTGQRPDTQQAFRSEDLYHENHEEWERVLKEKQEGLWKHCENSESQLGIATVSVNSSEQENIFSAALYRNVLLRVGQYEQMSLWKVTRGAPEV